MLSIPSHVYEEMSLYVERCLPHLSIDCVIFRYNNDQLQVLIVQSVVGDIWLVPGGYVQKAEDIDVAARRILLEQTELDNLILNQFGTFGSADRSFPELSSQGAHDMKSKEMLNWITQRFVTIGYYSLIRDNDQELRTSNFHQDIKWINIDDRDELSLDHNTLVTSARKKLAQDLLGQPVMLGLLPETFTMPQMHRLYELILDRSIDRGNFRQRILKAKFLIKLGKSPEKTSSRPPLLYKIDKDAYLSSLHQNIKLGF